MRVLEFAGKRKKDSFALAFVLSLASSNAELEEELSQVKSAAVELLNGPKNYEMIMLTVVAEQNLHALAEQQVQAIYESPELHHNLHNIPIRVALLNPDGEPLKEYVIGGNSGQPTDIKPSQSAQLNQRNGDRSSGRGVLDTLARLFGKSGKGRTE